MEPELHLGEQVMVPDLAGWRRERMPEPPQEAYFTLSSDWICEVLSPSTAQIDRALKLPSYGREGVEWAWLIDPLAHTLEIFRYENGHWTLLHVFAGDDPVKAPPFDAIDLHLNRLWGKADPPPTEAASEQEPPAQGSDEGTNETSREGDEQE